TLLTRTFCNARAIDTSNASFTGLYATTTLGGWHDELLSAAGVSAKQLPEVVEADAVVGSVTAAAAARFGLTEGTPMLAGIMDGSCAMLLAGAKAGQVVNVVGSTDVLAVCTDTAMPDPAVLTRALGRGKRWLSVGTLAASGTAIDWARKTFFADLGKKDFKKLMTRLINQPADPQLVFRPTLAGSRTSNDLPAAEITGLKLAHTRDDILRAMLEGLAVASAERFGHFQRLGLRMRRDVLSTGGGNDILATLLRRDWPGRWTFREEEDATLRGVWMLAESAK
ncbi:MAG TPA: FGGY family carbohydrate kinase, partial [Tepidisphaeraceae bacterium]